MGGAGHFGSCVLGPIQQSARSDGEEIIALSPPPRSFTKYIHVRHCSVSGTCPETFPYLLANHAWMRPNWSLLHLTKD